MAPTQMEWVVHISLRLHKGLFPEMPLANGNGITTSTQMEWIAHISLRLQKGHNDPIPISLSARLLLPSVDREHFETVALESMGPFLDWEKRKEEKSYGPECFRVHFACDRDHLLLFFFSPSFVKMLPFYFTMRWFFRRSERKKRHAFSFLSLALFSSHICRMRYIHCGI